MNTTLVINSKGGSGKTTVTTNLASCFAASGAQTTLLDYDPQGSSLNWLRLRDPLAPRIHGASAVPQKIGLRSMGLHQRAVSWFGAVTQRDPALAPLQDGWPAGLVWLLRAVYPSFPPASECLVPRHRKSTRRSQAILVSVALSYLALAIRGKEFSKPVSSRPPRASVKQSVTWA